MSWIKRATQHLGALILPSTATAFFLGLAVYENGIIRVFSHVSRNIILLAPRTLHVLKQMWSERKELLSTDQLVFNVIILIFGMPFIALLVLLDDYEEGSWTPTLNSYSGTPTFSNAEYVKAGNLVLVSLTVLLDGTADASRFEVSSLPFTSVNTTASSQGGGVSYTDSTFSRNIYVLVTSNSTRFGLYEEGGSNCSYTEVGTNKEIRLFVIYKSQ